MATLELNNLDAGFKKAWSIKVTFSLIVLFYLTKTENRTIKSHFIALSKGTVFAKK